MVMVPGPQRVDVFDLKLRGSFGRFKTDASHALQYLSTTLRIDQVANLKVAAEVFDIGTLDFEELIQRDIDHSRVVRIAEGYLQMGARRAVFFPPLLICLAVMDDNDELKSSYSSVETQPIHERTLRAVYDGDGFQLDLYQADPHAGGRSIQWNDQTVSFFDYAALLAVNTRRAKLIVLDGQHRQRALAYLHNQREKRHVVADIEQPVCIVWMPQAIVGADEEIIKDLRQIFVTVNTEPQRVSGHFILLLNDSSNAAAAVRSLANFWKKVDAGGWSRLHLLEWNTRKDESIDQRQRPFSITTVSIVARALEQYLFNAPRMAPAVLRLADVEAQIEDADADFESTGLRDEVAPLRVQPIIEAQISAHLTPALDHLLRRLRPYREIEERLGRSFVRLREAARQSPGSMHLEADLNRYVYSEKEMQNEYGRAAWAQFKLDTNLPADDVVFCRHAFQQGYLRFWLALQRELIGYGIEALSVAKAAVAATDAFTTLRAVRYLAEEQAYARRVLWKNDNINFGPGWTRDAWTDIQLAALLREDVREALIQQLRDQLDAQQTQTLSQRLASVGHEAVQRYTAVLKLEILRDVKRNLADFYGEVEAGNLRQLRQTAPDEFEAEVGKMADEKFQQALLRLANALLQELTDLRPVE